MLLHIGHDHGAHHVLDHVVILFSLIVAGLFVARRVLRARAEGKRRG